MNTASSRQVLSGGARLSTEMTASDTYVAHSVIVTVVLLVLTTDLIHIYKSLLNEVNVADVLSHLLHERTPLRPADCCRSASQTALNRD